MPETAETKRTVVESACQKACSACPWRLSNQQKQHPLKWYTLANLRRLWKGLRDGEKMTCHPTDPDNPLPEGVPELPKDVVTRECSGYLTLAQREFYRFQKVAESNPDFKGREAYREYKRQNPKGMTFAGLQYLLERALYGANTKVMGLGAPMTKPDLNDDDIGFKDVQPWQHIKQEAPKEAT